MTPVKKWQRKTLHVDGKRIAVWPSKLQLAPVSEESIQSVVFDDIENFHASLQQAILERESDPQYGMKLFRGACGVKVHHVERWKSPAANLVHQRALALCSAVLGVEDPVCDISWANVYRQGDYCMPHSHRRTEASVIYLLASGGTEEAVVPELVPGMMLVFPSQAMHYVNPYVGETPRITLSWNISSHRIAGSANPQLDRQRAETLVRDGT
jgi:hypothetical protein